ncbi:putative F-box/LRR-repeat protein 9 [Salvia divinorum]|uniref:F-box/LRR-repeat protein 9 n=1 Tax=Salvia divinorum TaxID=28513 RepID=A0ABD1HH43_SALDI
MLSVCMSKKSKSNEPIIQPEPSIPTAAMAASSSSAPPPSPFPPPPPPPWTELPEDLTANILQRLHTEEILESAQLVCTTWRRVCKDPAIWRVIHLDYRRFAPYEVQNIFRQASAEFTSVCRSAAVELENICRCGVDGFERIFRRAVDRSQGQLVELKLAGYAVDRLLCHVSKRSCQLRCLTLVEYDSETTLFPLGIDHLTQLEELHLLMMPKLYPKDFETIGKACPMLKSFTYHNCWLKRPDLSGHVAAIGKTMPNLHHLRLCEHSMGNKGQEAVLHGCPHLKSLDLQRCSGHSLRRCAAYYLREALGERRSEQVEYMWLHSDSFSFIDWLMRPSEGKDKYDIDSEYDTDSESGSDSEYD